MISGVPELAPPVQLARRVRYHEALVHPALASLPGARHVLLMGGGDGLARARIAADATVDSVTLVDLDPASPHCSRRMRSCSRSTTRRCARRGCGSSTPTRSCGSTTTAAATIHHRRLSGPVELRRRKLYTTASTAPRRGRSFALWADGRAEHVSDVRARVLLTDRATIERAISRRIRTMSTCRRSVNGDSCSPGAASGAIHSRFRWDFVF